MLTPKILEKSLLIPWVIFATVPLSVIISDATVSGKSEGISMLVHILSDFITSALANEWFFNKSANKNIENIIDMLSAKLSFINGFVFFVILQPLRS